MQASLRNLALCVTVVLCGTTVTDAQPRRDAGLLVPVPIQLNETATALLDAHFYDYQVVELPVEALERWLETTGRLDLALGGRLFRLDLAPVDLFAPDYRGVLQTDLGPVEIDRPRPGTYQGAVAGQPEIRVALTVTPGFFTLSLRGEDSPLFVDPLSDFVPRSPRHLAVVYTGRDVRPETLGDCGAIDDPASAVGASHIGAFGRVIGQAHTTLRRLDVATDADGEYFNRHGSPGTFNRIAAIVNDADVVYQRDVNLDLRISYQQAWSNPASDPYVSTYAPSLLAELRSWWNANRAGTTRDVTHLFSGKDFDGATVGYANIATVCASPSYSYGVNQDYGGSFIRAELFAHELGHNLSALHGDATGCTGVNCNGSGPIMCPSIQSSGSFTFSTCSQSAIGTFTHNNGGCLN